MPRILGIDRVNVGPETLGGVLPIGSVVPVMSNISGSFAPPSTGQVKDGFMLADGAAIPAEQALSGNTPDITGDRFIMGAATAGTTGGNANNQITPSGSNSGGAASFNKNVMNTNQTSHNHQWMTSTGGSETFGPDGSPTAISRGTASDPTGDGYVRSTQAGGRYTNNSTVAWASNTVNTNFTQPTFTGNPVSILPLYVTGVYLIRVN